MDALEQLSQYRHVEPVDDGVVAAAVETISAALAADHRRATARTWLASRRRRHGRRTAIACGGALVALAGGGGIAAAAGLFDSATPLPQAQLFQSSTDPAKVPGATLRLSVPGPEGFTLQVVTDHATAVDQSDTCVALGIIGPDGRPAATHGYATCSGLVAPPGSTVPPQQPATTPSGGVETWKAPSGVNYDLIFGQSAPGIAQVRLVSRDGVVEASEPANAHGYVVYIPSARFTSYSRLIFTDTFGKVVFSEDLNS